MIKEIKTEKFEGLVVLVPDDASYFSTHDDTMFNHLIWNTHSFTNKKWIVIPDGDFKILGKATELTEEQCAEIVVSIIASEVDHGAYLIDETFAFEDYTDEENAFDNAKESFASLMESLQCYSVNPLGDKPEFSFNHYGKSPIEFSRFEVDMYKWQEAQVNTGTWLILKKV